MLLKQYSIYFILLRHCFRQSASVGRQRKCQSILGRNYEYCIGGRRCIPFISPPGGDFFRAGGALPENSRERKTNHVYYHDCVLYVAVADWPVTIIPDFGPAWSYSLYLLAFARILLSFLFIVSLRDVAKPASSLNPCKCLVRGHNSVENHILDKKCTRFSGASALWYPQPICGENFSPIFAISFLRLQVLSEDKGKECEKMNTDILKKSSNICEGVCQHRYGSPKQDRDKRVFKGIQR